MKLTCSLIICTKDRQDDLARCLDSVLEQRRRPDEVVIVASGTDDSESVVQSFAAEFGTGRVRFIHSEPSLTLQRNIGVSSATGQILHFLDDDTVLDAEYTGEIQATFEDADSEGVVAVSPMLRQEYGLSGFSLWLRRVFMLPHFGGQGHLMPSGFASYPWNNEETEVREIEIACGCCAYRREVFDETSFDEFFSGYAYMEDLDFVLGAAKLGKILLNPRAIVVHNETPGGRPDYRERSKMDVVNHRYVFKKHMPQTVLCKTCYWWSVFGEGLIRFRQGVGGNWDAFTGWLDGLKAIMRGDADAAPKSNHSH